MIRRVPLFATLLGITGLVPFVLLALLSLGPDPVEIQRMTLLLIAYGAVILSFLGGVHWGFALLGQDIATPRVERGRLLLGVVPSLIGWAALALPVLALPAWAGLLVLIAGFLATVIVEQRAHRRGLMPPGYIWLRWALTIVVVALLVTVATLHILGQSINFWNSP